MKEVKYLGDGYFLIDGNLYIARKETSKYFGKEFLKGVFLYEVTIKEEK